MQKRTSPLKFAHVAEKSGFKSVPSIFHSRQREREELIRQRELQALESVRQCAGASCPGGAAVPQPDPAFVRKPFPCMWPA